MITLTIENKEYNVPTTWMDVDYDLFCRIISFKEEEKLSEFVSLVSGIPCSTIENLDTESFLMIESLITFVEDYSFLEKFNVVKEGVSFDPGKDTWWKLEKAKQALQKHSKPIFAMAEVIKIYFNKDILKAPIYLIWGEINYIQSQINKFFEDYKRLGEYEEDEHEFMANVKRFERFGFFCSCVELSRKMGKTYNEVLNMQAREIYQTFLYDFERSDYEKTLFRLKNKSA